MQAAIALIIVSMTEVQSILSIIGGLRAKKFWHVLLIAIFATIFGEALRVLIYSNYSAPIFFIYRLIGQTIVAFTIFILAGILRRQNIILIKYFRVSFIRLLILLVVSVGCFTAGLFLGSKNFNMQRPEQDMPHEVLGNTHIQIEKEKLLYREPIEMFWNDWTEVSLAEGKVFISGEGKTVSFNGIVQLTCEGDLGHRWLTASNYSVHQVMNEDEIALIVPMQVISAAVIDFCPRK